MNYIGALAVEGKKSTTVPTNGCRRPRAETFEDRKTDTIKLTSLVAGIPTRRRRRRSTS